MSKFKVGDVCETTVDSRRYSEVKAGTECTVISLESAYPGWISVECSVLPCEDERGFAVPPEKLRLKRPPTWDSWIYDTSDIRPEIGVEA